MSTERHSAFTQLDPPPGGAERFARRLDEAAPRPPQWHRFALAAAVGAAAVLAVAIVMFRDPPELATDAQASVDVYNAPEFDRLLGRQAQAAELTATVNDQMVTVTEVATQNTNVRIYSLN